MTSSKIKKRGFTLVEMLIYATGVVLIMGAIVGALYYSYRWYERAVIPSRADEVGSSIASRMMNDLRAGEAIDLPSSAFNISNGRLGIFVKDNAGSSIYKSYYLNNGRIMYKEGVGGQAQYLSPSDMRATELKFHYSTTPNSTDIRFSMSFNYLLRTATTGQATSTYSGQATMRNSYE